MAEELLKKILAALQRKDVEVSSAGVAAFPGAKPTQGVIEVMAKEGLNVSNHSAAPLTKEKIESADLILTMDFSQKEKVLEMAPQAKEKTFLLNIPDPIGRPLEDYQICANQIKEALDKLVRRI